MKKIAITGNIGSGKSWVCELWSQRLGIPVYNSDTAAKQMYFVPEVRKKLVEHFSNAIYLSDTEIDRKYLADLVFHDESAQRDLEGILYPALFLDFEQWMAKQNAPYVLFESALVFEKRLGCATIATRRRFVLEWLNSGPKKANACWPITLSGTKMTTKTRP